MGPEGRRPGPLPAVLGFGDSISLGPEEGSFGVPPHPWAQWLALTLGLPFHRVAVPGSVTPWMAEHLLPRTAASGYALACVHAGTNDVRSPDWDAGAYRAALMTILATLAGAAERVCVATVPHDLGRPRAGAKVAELGGIVRDVAAGAGAVVVDLDDLRGWRLVFPDAVHPTALGQLEIADRAADALGLTERPSVILARGQGVPHGLPGALVRQAGHLRRDLVRRIRRG